jgi:hypothetical protein
VRLFSYPAWEVAVNGHRTATWKTDITGLLVIPIGAGNNDVQIHFRRTNDRVVGDLVSLISSAVLAAVWFGTSRGVTRERLT